jgi:hypothetical protein
MYDQAILPIVIALELDHVPGAPVDNWSSGLQCEAGYLGAPRPINKNQKHTGGGTYLAYHCQPVAANVARV